MTIRYGGNEVHYQAGAPRPGFAIEVENTGPGEVEVEFESDGHESRFEAEMENGELNPVITEKSS